MGIGTKLLMLFSNQSSPWYLAGGISPTDVVAAYSPEGAASLADSYKNLVTPGTHDAIESAAPTTWDAANGWKGNGSQYVKTDIVPASNHTYTYIIKYNSLVLDASQSGKVLFGSQKTGGALLQILPAHGAAPGLVIYQPVTNMTVRPSLTSGIMAISGMDCYANGQIAMSTATPADKAYVSPYIMGRNDDGSVNAGTIIKINVQKVAIYSRKLTYQEIYAVNIAMNAPARASFWTRHGAVVTPTQVAEGIAVQEPSVIYEGNAQILTGNVFKMWYTGGSGQLCYAESSDALTWTKHASNPLVLAHTHMCVMKVDTTYYLYARMTADATKFDLYTSADGISWTLISEDLIPTAVTSGNSFVWNEDATHWYMLYDTLTGGVWVTNLATSSDGVSWTPYASNPVLGTPVMAAGGCVWKNPADNKYWYWTQRALYDVKPTDIWRYYSTDLINWTLSPSGAATIRRIDPAIDAQQTADPSIIEVNGKTYMFFTGSVNATTIFSIELATVDMTLAQLVATSEGI